MSRNEQRKMFLLDVGREDGDPHCEQCQAASRTGRDDTAPALREMQKRQLTPFHPYEG